MIKRLINRIFRRQPKPSVGPATQHMAPESAAYTQVLKSYRGSEQGIRLEDLSPAAVRTCESLRQTGYLAYIVGGGVRDSLLGRKPKDFDVATNATPEQVTRLFRRSRLIGRRFQIVHVMFGRETIEVSTFRALQTDAETDEHGRVLRDNVWGSIEEDAARRDFTVNALYYDPTTDILLDYHRGVDDLRAKLLRMIGDPATRYREDPIRMLRSARFAAKLGFVIEENTRRPIRELASLIHNVPAARLFDEILKLLESGHAKSASVARRGPASRHLATARYHCRTTRRRTLHSSGANPHRRASRRR
jgi:poly(A) polymerase